MTKKISSKDKKDWENFTKSKDKLENKDLDYIEVNKKIDIKSIDLHGCNLNEANKKIKNFIEKSFSQRVDTINVITGKGSRSKNKHDPYQSLDLGILKYSVPEFIKNNDELMKIIKNIDFNAINDEGQGSFHITLKKNNL